MCHAKFINVQDTPEKQREQIKNMVKTMENEEILLWKRQQRKFIPNDEDIKVYVTNLTSPVLVRLIKAQLRKKIRKE